MNDKEVLKRIEKMLTDIFVKEYFEKEDRIALETIYRKYKKYIQLQNKD